eukprot:3753479-Amphidinium_carterae.1
MYCTLCWPSNAPAGLDELSSSTTEEEGAPPQKKGRLRDPGWLSRGAAAATAARGTAARANSPPQRVSKRSSCKGFFTKVVVQSFPACVGLAGQGPGRGVFHYS